MMASLRARQINIRALLNKEACLVRSLFAALSATFSGDYNLFNEINEFLNILQSIQLPFAMLPVLHFASSADLLRLASRASSAIGADYITAVVR